MIKNIIVVDTVGDLEALHSSYINNFPFVDKWSGYEPLSVSKTIPHPHGGFCMSQSLLPVWDDKNDVHAHFIRIFDSTGNSLNNTEWVLDHIRRISKTGPTWVNNSWGAYIGSRDPAPWRESADLWRQLIKETGVTVMWAAGNSGDFLTGIDEDVPQGLLIDVSSKIAAGLKNGRTAEYSSDSTFAPPIATFWSTEVRLLNPVTAMWELASGTSFAAPKATGLAAKRGLTYESFIQLAKDKSSKPTDYNGILPHAKWGYGWLEEENQIEIKDCPYRYESTSIKSVHNDSMIWLDFELRDYRKVQ